MKNRYFRDILFQISLMKSQYFCDISFRNISNNKPIFLKYLEFHCKYYFAKRIVIKTRVLFFHISFFKYSKTCKIGTFLWNSTSNGKSHGPGGKCQTIIIESVPNKMETCLKRNCYLVPRDSALAGFTIFTKKISCNFVLLLGICISKRKILYCRSYGYHLYCTFFIFVFQIYIYIYKFIY